MLLIKGKPMEYKMHDVALKRIECDRPSEKDLMELEDRTCTTRSLFAEGVEDASSTSIKRMGSERKC